jgi:hypothetical protein
MTNTSLRLQLLLSLLLALVLMSLMVYATNHVVFPDDVETMDAAMRRRRVRDYKSVRSVGNTKALSVENKACIFYRKILYIKTIGTVQLKEFG